MITCAIIAGAIVLTTPDGTLLLPMDTAVTITAADPWYGDLTLIDFGWHHVEIKALLADVQAAVGECKGAQP